MLSTDGTSEAAALEICVTSFMISATVGIDWLFLFSMDQSSFLDRTKKVYAIVTRFLSQNTTYYINVQFIKCQYFFHVLRGFYFR